MPKEYRRLLSNTYILVIRWNGIHFSMSKPCKHCISYMKLLGLKKVYYTGDDNALHEEKMRDIESDHISVIRKIFDPENST